MIDTFLLIGQSNMAGRGFAKDVAPIVDPRIRMLRNGRWQMMSEPVNYDRPFSGIGLSASFAKAWCGDHPEDEIGLIPCADGGSALSEWMPGEPLFDHAVSEARFAARNGKLKGILWHQGETDCPKERMDVYEEKLEIMLSELRLELNANEIPFLIGGLGDFLPACPIHDYFVNTPMMNEHLRHFAETHQDCFFITAEGLLANPDGLHFNAASQRIFGYRYYESFKHRKHVFSPLSEETIWIRNQQHFQDLSPEEKLEALKLDLLNGTITRQFYEAQAEKLVGMM